MSGFNDYFSTRAEAYGRYRPTYPKELYTWLAKLSPGHTLAWDCATGAGQAARALADFFDRVIATDASADQITNCQSHPQVAFRVASAEQSGLPEACADLITAAAAVHWFNLDLFYAEVRRVARPGAPIVVWSYSFFTVNKEIDDVLEHYAKNILGAYWPPEIALIDNNYRDLPFPFTRINGPQFEITRSWKLDWLLGYLTTWSACKNYWASKGEEPLDLIRDALAEAWGPTEQERLVRWPLFYLAGTSS